MLEYAYHLFDVREGLAELADTRDIFESLAEILSQRILDRAARGLYREYIEEDEVLPYLRGRLLVSDSIRLFARGNTRLGCRFHDHTADVWQNQILLLALDRLRYFRFRRATVEWSVRRAHRTLALHAHPNAHSLEHLKAPVYNRLNQDYRTLHALASFFLENLGPRHQAGDRPFVPYLICMWRLFERFVYAWLEESLKHARPDLELRGEIQLRVDEEGRIWFKPDLVLVETASTKPVAVLDTKYKLDPFPATEDVQQVIAYANHLEVGDAFLIYPSSGSVPCDFTSGSIRVRSCVFDLSQDLDRAGRQLLFQLGVVQ